MNRFESASQIYREKFGVDVEKALETAAETPVSLHCWQGDDVRGFDTDPDKPLTGGIQTTGNYPGRARTTEELMAERPRHDAEGDLTHIGPHRSSLLHPLNDQLRRSTLERVVFVVVDVIPGQSLRQRPELSGQGNKALAIGGDLHLSIVRAYGNTEPVNPFRVHGLGRRGDRQ